MNDRLPRGLRNFNPGNIRYDGTKWRGLVGDDGAFCIFDKPENGIRAIAKILKSYNARGINTVSEIINTWAPPIENDTKSYIRTVCDAIGCTPDHPITQEDYPELIGAIIYHENGQNPYKNSQIMAGITASLGG